MKKNCILFLLYIVSFTPTSYALLLTPSNYLDVYFSFESQPSQSIDVFSYAIHGIDIQAQGLISVSLYDNDNYIASYNELTQGYTRVFTFVSENTLYTQGNPTTVDFTSFRDGTIKGMLRFSTDVGQFDVDPYFSTMAVGIATDYNNFYYHTSWSPNITNAVATTIPLPNSLVFFISGILGLFSFKNRSHNA